MPLRTLQVHLGASALRAAASTPAILLAAAALIGCGGGDGEDATTASAPPPPPPLAEPAPKGSSALLAEVYRQFQPPQPDPQVKGSAKAIAAGEETCEGKTPAQITETYIAQSDLTEDQERSVAQLPRFEANPSPSFPAGQVAALVYQMTLGDEELSPYGFQGCVYSLAQGLKEDLAPAKQEKSR